MRLTDHEKAMLDGAHGKAKARAMDLLVRYGEALGAERLVETNNVAGAFNASTPSVRALAARGFDAVYSELNLDSDEVVEVPRMAVNTCQLITGIDNAKWRTQGIPDDLAEQQKRGEAFFGQRGINMHATCTPYQVGNVPVKGEHCAWMESSAVVYCNSVLGARTNTEGKEIDRRRGLDRPHSRLGVSPRRQPPWHASRRSRYSGRRHHGLGLAGLLARRDRAGPNPGAHRRARQPDAHQAQAFRRRRLIVGRRRDVSPARHDAGGAPRSRKPSADGRLPTHCAMVPRSDGARTKTSIARASARSTSSCSVARTIRSSRSG